MSPVYRPVYSEVDARLALADCLEEGTKNIWGTALIGIAGSFVGAFLGQLLGFLQSGDYGGFFWAIVGSVVLLFIYGLLFKKKPAAPVPPAPPPPTPAS